MNASLVFLAAGFGSRFGGGVKQIEPVGPNGEVLMDYAVHDALAAGFNRVVFIIRRDIEAEFRAGVGRRVERRCDVEYVYQDLNDLPPGFQVPAGRVKPWGTGQALLACRNVIREDFCVLNADDFYGAEAFHRIYDYLSRRKEGEGLDLCMAGYVLGNTLSESGAVTRGLCRADEQGRLLGIRETKGIMLRDGAPWVQEAEVERRLDPASSVSMNIWGMPAKFIDYLSERFEPFLENLGGEALTAEYLLPTVVGRMIESGRGTAQMLPVSERWFGMTYAQDKVKTQRSIRERIARGDYPEHL